MINNSTALARAALHRFAGDERGATSIEYALIASGISIVIAGVVAGLGSNIKTMYQSVSTALK
jgi:pilus assembly protein Flp/PilA